MRQWMPSGVIVALALLFLPGCSGSKPEATGSNGAGATGNVSQDAQITKAVQAKLDADPTLQATHIQAKTVGGQMDEPCSALDPNATYRIEQLMEELKRSYTLLIVTHNLQQARGSRSGQRSS